MDQNEYYYQEQETLHNWQRYLEDTQERSSHMWNSILYNQFVNEEVRRLNTKICFLKDDLKKEKSSYNKLHHDNEKLKKSLGKYEKQDEPSNKRKRSELSKWLTSEKRKKPKNYETLEKNMIDRKLIETFKNLSNLNDQKVMYDATCLDLLI